MHTYIRTVTVTIIGSRKTQYTILDGTSVSYNLTEKITNSIFITNQKKNSGVYL